MITNGPYFEAALDALQLEGPELADARRNASEIVHATMAAYGMRTDQTLDTDRIPNALTTGLVYGRIQSGKTRAMIASTAMAFDNGFRISVVMTSNINDLVAQTHLDFSHGLPGIMTFTKDNDLEREVANARLHLEHGDGRLLLVCSKGAKSLENISQFLEDIGAERYPTILFDDEGDQASLDTNTRRRSLGVAVAPSSINAIIQGQLRPAVPRHVYVGVTGTPQAVLLQSANSANRPSYIAMLPPGRTYVGGDQFFDVDEPEDNPSLIALVDGTEQRQLLNAARPIPPGLRRSLLFFLVSAGAAVRNLGAIPEKGYSYLCHPSLKNDEQAVAEQRINSFLTDVFGAILGQPGGEEILRDLRTEHSNLQQTLGARTPAFQEAVDIIRQFLPGRRLLVINARTKRQGIDYGRGLNFLIGGNTLGRGIAIRDLLVTYYVRDARISQIDTMHQHARMYGYRQSTLPYTRLFVPRHLYYRFRDIHRSDRELRTFIEHNRAELPTTFPVEYTSFLRTTRPGVLDVTNIDTLQPGMQVYPNYVTFPQDSRAYQRVLDLLRRRFHLPAASVSELEAVGPAGVEIGANEACDLVEPIRTGSRNTWRDRTINSIIKKVAASFGNRVTLRFRTARRRVREGGFISTGTLSGDELSSARAANTPTLWIMAVKTGEGSEVGANLDFMYPTLVIPDSLPRLFMFNRG
jgi:hypothetical protein